MKLALAHVLTDKTEAAYYRTDLFDRRRDLMDLWSQFATRTPATVVAIAASRPNRDYRGLNTYFVRSADSLRDLIGIEIKGLVLVCRLRYAAVRCCRDCRATRRRGSIA